MLSLATHASPLKASPNHPTHDGLAASYGSFSRMPLTAGSDPVSLTGVHTPQPGGGPNIKSTCV